MREGCCVIRDVCAHAVYVNHPQQCGIRLLFAETCPVVRRALDVAMSWGVVPYKVTYDDPQPYPIRSG